MLCMKAHILTLGRLNLPNQLVQFSCEMCFPAFEPITSVPGSNQESSSSISQCLQLGFYCRPPPPRLLLLLLQGLAGRGRVLIGRAGQNTAAADVAGIYQAQGKKHFPGIQTERRCGFGVFFSELHW